MPPKTLMMRMKKETERLVRDPPPGIAAWPREDDMQSIEAVIEGPEDSPYHKGMFKVDVAITDRYPFEPPQVRFTTSIYHPNIDASGRICLDLLNMPPKGAWKPSLNISTVLMSIRLLLAEPNPDDGLMTDITAEYKNNKALFLRKAKESTVQHAIECQKGKDNESRSEDAESRSDDVGPSEAKRAKTTGMATA